MTKPSISVVVPTWNEEGNVSQLIDRIHAALTKADFVYEVVFIDDNSTDKTRQIIKDYAKREFPVRVELKKGTRGKAQSLLQGFKLAKNDLIAMIDADLQYAPEEIPAMAKKIYKDGFDVVQSRRVTHNEGRLRAFFSWGFSFFFIRLLHGLKFDTQSALKVFKRQVSDEITVASTKWTFDLEFLLKALNAGYKITNHDISFSERLSGEAKLSVLEATWEIGSNALKLKFTSLHPVHIKGPEEGSMLGAGHAYKGKRFITHSSLPHQVSALRTLVPWQKYFLWSLVIICLAGFYLFPLEAAIILTAVLSCIYFADVLFNLYVVSRSLTSPPELNFTDQELKEVDHQDLPVYTILCPLYREAHILPGFLGAIEKLDWPKSKLDVMLLLEANDKDTIDVANHMELPDYVRVVVVPHSMPKTKPKACNYGLSFARGEYLVIYDAEDVPEPQQLKKAYLGFNKVPDSVMCLQAKLNYFNPSHNLLTRLFTAEYSLWFDVILPGLQSINGYIPLGGTSNHFRTQDLLDLKGWDPFNVTEDCDLGARLFKMGRRTAIIDSTTLEEANSNVRNWLRQRSRWIKGYMQTYLVHMRHPVKFLRESGIHAVVFQLVVGGKIAFMLINPILWLMTISYFTMRATVGPTIEALYPPVIFYVAIFSLLAGNFLYLYYYMIGCAKRGHWRVIKYVYMVPVYWLLASIASVIALYQLVVKPHFWEKTNHGLHLKKVFVKYDEGQELAGAARKPRFRLLPESWDGSLVAKGGLFLVVMSMANLLNFAFNAFLGRVLSFEQLALVTFVNTLWYLASLFVNAFGTTVNHKISFLEGNKHHQQANEFYRTMLNRAMGIALALSLSWVMVSPIISDFFHISDPTILLLFTPVFSLGILAAANRGYLQGRLFFGLASSALIFESLSKLAFGVLFVILGHEQLVYLSIPLSILVAAVVSTMLLPKVGRIQNSPEHFPKDFYIASLLTGLSATVFLSLDIILVKHFLSAAKAGEYVLLSLVGKMIYFFGSLPNSLMVTLVSREQGLNRDTRKVFYVLFALTTALVTFGAFFLGPLGHMTIPILLGAKTLSILPYVNVYVLAIAIFTLANVIVSYHLARKQFAFPLASLVVSLFMTGGIVIFHQDIGGIVNVIFFSSLFGLGLLSLMHILEPQLEFARRNWIDFVDVFKPGPAAIPVANDNKRILVFNWRDTKHVFSGGAEVYIHEMAKQWVLAGNKVTVFCGNDSKSLRHEMVDGVEVIRRGGFYMVYAWAFIYYMFRFRGNYDMVIDCQNGIPFFTPLYVKEPVFCVMHHVHQEIFRKYLSFPLAMVAQFLEKHAMPVVYKNIKFVTVSPSTKTQMTELGLVGSGVEIIHNGVDLSKFKPGKKFTTPTVLYLGRLKAYKSVDVLIKAFKDVLAEIPWAKLVIAGNGEEEAALKKLSQELELSGSVHFAGRVDEAEKINLMQSSWVFVNPSFIEGWGITTIEAGACATPVVASNVAGLRDSVLNPHTGYLVEHGNVQVFAQRIANILKNKELRSSMGVSGHEWAQNFEWQKTSADFLGLIKSELANTAYVYENENT